MIEKAHSSVIEEFKTIAEYLKEYSLGMNDLQSEIKVSFSTIDELIDWSAIFGEGLASEAATITSSTSPSPAPEEDIPVDVPVPE